MGRVYAGILGLLAFTTIVFRGVVRGGGLEATVTTACVGLFAFAAVGYILGQIAGAAVDDAVRHQFEESVKASAQKGPAASRPAE